MYRKQFLRQLSFLQSLLEWYCLLYTYRAAREEFRYSIQEDPGKKAGWRSVNIHSSQGKHRWCYPVIFAQSLLQTPVIIASLLGKGNGTGIGSKILRGMSQSNWCNPSEPIYSIGLVVYIVLIIAFAYFYTSITFNPLEIANNMKKAGGFIPGIRPGKPTSDYLNRILNYIVFIGAVALAFIAFVPIFFNGVFGADVSFGGTSIIIIVGVVIETLKQIESQMRVRYYKGFLND